LGSLPGFDLEVTIPTTADDGPCFILNGRRGYAAHHSDNPQGIVRVVENVANGLEGRLAEACEDMARAEKRLADILSELAKPFEKEERLTQLLVRQREINAVLDLDKDNAGAMEAEAKPLDRDFSFNPFGNPCPMGLGFPTLFGGSFLQES